MANQDMLINYVHGEECRIAIVEDGQLEELYTERSSADLHVSNIYRGRVTNVEANIQAAFVDFGEERSGFLHVTDLHPQYFPGEQREATERVGHKTPRKQRPPIQQCLKPGQEILVQVLKEGIGGKGPTLTSYLSIPGRYLVMMPNMQRHGVSRKVEDPEERKKTRQVLDELKPPQDMGFIVRTAGVGRPKTEMKRDLNYLLRLWKNLKSRMNSGRGPRKLYTESDLVIRTLRDVLTTDVKRIIVDDRLAALRAKDFLRIYMPRTKTKVIHHQEAVPLFDAFGVESQIQAINQRQVDLDCGGSLVFDQTEAMVTIDVNSGKFRDARDSEDNAFRTNKEAVDEIARQLRLRDMGGLLVLDLIDMYQHRHRREIERRFREDLKKDRARTKTLRISELGMLEMTRQRMRPSLKKSIFDECPTCHGAGQILSVESVVLNVMRELAMLLSNDKVTRVTLAAQPQVLEALLNRRRAGLVALERRTGKAIDFHGDEQRGPDDVELTCYSESGEVVQPEQLRKPRKPNYSKQDEVTTDDLSELEELERQRGIQREDVEGTEAEEPEEGQEQESGGKKKRRRRRRKSKKSTQASEAGADQSEGEARQREGGASGGDRGEDGEASSERAAAESVGGESSGEEESSGGTKRKRRRRGGRRRRKSKPSDNGDAAQDTAKSEEGESAGSEARVKGGAASSDEASAPSSGAEPVSRGYTNEAEAAEAGATPGGEAGEASSDDQASNRRGGASGSGRGRSGRGGGRKKSSSSKSSSKKKTSSSRKKTVASRSSAKKSGDGGDGNESGE